MKLLLGKKVNIRLNDSAVLNIYKYKTKRGDLIHSLTIRYEGEEPSCIELGKFRQKSSDMDTLLIDKYDFNNRYIVAWEEGNKIESFKYTMAYDVEKRCDLLTNSDFDNYFKFNDAMDNIEEHKLKHLKLNRKIKKRS